MNITLQIYNIYYKKFCEQLENQNWSLYLKEKVAQNNILYNIFQAYWNQNEKGSNRF